MRSERRKFEREETIVCVEMSVDCVWKVENKETQ